MKVIWVHRTVPDNRWCVLRSAAPGEFISTLCCQELEYRQVNITTRRPHNTCPACETELAAGTPGAAVAIDAVPDAAADDAITAPRAITEDLRPAHRRTDSPRAWDGDGAFVHLEDVQP